MDEQSTITCLEFKEAKAEFLAGNRYINHIEFYMNSFGRCTANTCVAAILSY